MDHRSQLLAEEKVSKLLLRFSVPAIIGMLVMALYNLVDTIFVGKSVGQLGIAGIAIVFPIMMVLMALAQSIGIGGASIISRALGAKDNNRAEKTLGNVFLYIILMSLIVTISGLFFINPILRLFGASDTLLPYSRAYFIVILSGAFFQIFAMASNNIVRAEGNAKIAMFSMLIGAGVNILLDPFFIFHKIKIMGFTIPCFGMGVRGAAIATVIGQIGSSLLLASYFFNRHSTIVFHFKQMKLNIKILIETVSIGSAAFSRQVAGSIMIIVVNKSLIFYGGETSVAVFGIIFRLLMFTFMPLFGIIQGFQPIAGFAYGAKQIDRLKQSIRLANISTTIFSLMGFVLLVFFPQQVMLLFCKKSDTALITQGISAIRHIVVAMPLVGFQVVGAALYQSIGKAWPALFLSLSRQVVILIPLILLLPLFFQLKGIWYAFPLADICSFLITLIMFMFEMNQLNKLQLQEN
ncbi:MAG: MATE family efflux transporter [Spirochaetes bacterium]|nr:MATE family efflux transporter [Spirochaetota bacterium]